MKKQITIGLVLVTCLIFDGRNVFAQYQIKNSVFGNSATSTGNDQQQIKGTVGQSTTGVTQNAFYMHGVGFWFQDAVTSTSIEKMESKTLPTEYSLKQNYPNPFNPITTICFTVPKPAHVTLKLYDMLGRGLATLVDEKKEAGEYTLLFDASRLPSGIYYYQMKTEAFNQIRKLMLIK